MSRILIIENDRETCREIKEHLEELEYKVSYLVPDADAVNEIKAISPKLVILDMTLPHVNSNELLQQIKEFTSVSVVVVSDKNEENKKKEVLELGADDHLTKPYNLEELAELIEANLNEIQKSNQEIIVINNGFVIDTASKEVRVDNKKIGLTAREYGILELLVKHSNKVFSKKNLYESVWQDTFAHDNDIINTHISNLRRKLGKEGKRIVTVRGLGYRFEKREL